MLTRVNEHVHRSVNPMGKRVLHSCYFAWYETIFFQFEKLTQWKDVQEKEPFAYDS